MSQLLKEEATTVEACVRELQPYLIGKNPMNIEDIWNELYRGGFYRGGPILMSAIAGIDPGIMGY